MKKLISFILVTLTVLSFASCAKPEVVEETTESTAAQITEFASDLPLPVDPPVRFNPISDITDASSVKELIKGWATNGGDKMSNRNIMNILLIGEDYVDGSSRSDATILISIDKKAKNI